MAELTPVMKKFVLHWGEMGSKWGVNRTVGQIHALLYLSPEPMPADEIAETLSVARSNVSNSLRELQGWGVVKASHVLGDRRDHYEAMTDVWEMVRVVLDERKKREFDPTLAALRDLTDQAAKSGKSGKRDAYAHERLAEMLGFFESVAAWYTQMRRLPTGSVIKFVKAGDKLRRLLGLAP